MWARSYFRQSVRDWEQWTSHRMWGIRGGWQGVGWVSVIPGYGFNILQFYFYSVLEGILTGQAEYEHHTLKVCVAGEWFNAVAFLSLSLNKIWQRIIENKTRCRKSKSLFLHYANRKGQTDSKTVGGILAVLNQWLHWLDVDLCK